MSGSGVWLSPTPFNLAPECRNVKLERTTLVVLLSIQIPAPPFVFGRRGSLKNHSRSAQTQSFPASFFNNLMKISGVNPTGIHAITRSPKI